MNRNENQMIIKALNMYGRVPEQYELLEEIERLNNIIKEVRMFAEEYKKEWIEYDEVQKDMNKLLEIIEELKESDKE